MNRLVLWGAVLGLLFATGTAKASGPERPASREGQEELRSYLETLHEAGALPGFRIFAEAVARRESGFNSQAKNTSPTEAAAAARLFDGARSRGHFADNPHVGDRSAWTFGSGGWFGFLPSTGLAQGGHEGPWQQAHPSTIFDPIESTAMAAAYAAAIIRNYFDRLPASERNWLAVRRGWRSIALIPDWREEKETSRGVRKRFLEDIRRVTGWDEATAEVFAESPAKLGTYGGAQWARDLLRKGHEA